MRMKLKPWHALAAASLAFGGSMALAAQASDPAAAVSARQAAYRGMGAQFKTINEQLKSGNPDMPTVRASTAKVAEFTRTQFTLFPKGTGMDAGLDTKAKGEIWSDAAGFAAVQRSFVQAVAGLARAAAGTDTAAIQAATAEVGNQCRTCHEKYRAK